MLIPEYRNESQQKPPKQFMEAQQLSAHQLWTLAQQNTAVIWRGDFQQGKQLLTALKKRVRQKSKTGATAAETFHKHRLAQSQQSRLINSLLLEIHPNFQLCLPRAPNIQAALNDVYHTNNQHSFLLPFNQLLGFIGAHEWHKKGVWIDALNASIHVPFGVFSPLRGEYLDLIAQAPLPKHIKSAWDLGTGSGVIAALLAKRGIEHVIATDNNPRAILAASANFQRLNIQKIELKQQDGFEDEQVDLIVCNPPWLPAKPTSAIETALYDPQHSMLKSVLHQAATHLNPQGQLWLIMSNLAEHLGLRAPNDLNQWFQEARLHLKQVLSTQPKHTKAHNQDDPLAFARQKETTFLYILIPLQNL